MASSSSFQRLQIILLISYTVQISMWTATGNTLVIGAVFCDQCLDGTLSFFDYPISGAKVAVLCNRGATEYANEGTTNWAGSWTVRFEGSPDLSGCQAQVVAAPAGCGVSMGPAKGLSLVVRMLGVELYAVGPLLAHPTQPMKFCPRVATPVGQPVHTLPPPPPLLPLLPPSRSLPSSMASACPYYKWMMPEYKCSWRLITPDTTVALAFGPVAAGRYGTDMTLWEGLHGRGDVYRTLLREGIAALLNSYHSSRFYYPTLSVISQLNLALLGSPRQALLVAFRFRRANSGVVAAGQAHVQCNLSPCSS